MQNIEIIETRSDKKKSVNKPLENKNTSMLDDTNTDYQNQIAISAYYKAEKRGFIGSEEDALHDWLEAEKELKIVNS